MAIGECQCCGRTVGLFKNGRTRPHSHPALGRECPGSVSAPVGGEDYCERAWRALDYWRSCVESNPRCAPQRSALVSRIRHVAQLRI